MTSQLPTEYTLEDLREIAYRGSYDDMQRSLVRALLAAHEQEPVAWKWRLISLYDDEQIGPWRVCLAPLSPGNGAGCKTEAIPLYTNPAPVPVVPKTISVRTAIAALDNAESVTTLAQAYKMGWNACCSAMLNGGKS